MTVQVYLIFLGGTDIWWDTCHGNDLAFQQGRELVQ